MEKENKPCSCDKLKAENRELKKQVAELLGKIEKLEKFIKGGKV